MPGVQPSKRWGEPRKILVVLPTWVGDFVMATPTLRALRRRYPSAQITLLANPNLEDLIRGGTWMDEVIVWDAKRRRRGQGTQGLWRMSAELRRRRFDWAVLLSNSFRSALLVRLGGVTRRVGYARDGRGFLLNDPLPVPRADGAFAVRPMVEYYGAIAEALDCPPPGDDLELFTTPDCEERIEQRLETLDIREHRPLVVIAPGASFGSSKCWPTERFAALGDRLVDEMGAAVLVTCGPGEEQIAHDICEAMAQTSIVMDAPLLTLGDLKSLIRHCHLLVSNDTGPRHFAKAFGVPVVAIFGPTAPEWTDTSYPQERRVLIKVDCGPCQKPICPLGHLKCMTGVTVDMVMDACRELLQIRSSCGQGAAP
ncbi:MAG: lipopolysaccharide heptosyltransferase II [Planctomycetes bacterium]|nr:lipopolysaccharide heptosyltransferase II [Planctomycetota bacterium]